ncbi:MAG: XRE family transcriptional regulator [Nevskiaceae bacterium]|nr:MAG: XRE family transcriptional regulator [Nevskiaceae bacterium]
MANQALADRMKKIRESFRCSQKMMSSRLELGATTWQNYERGLNYPNGETLVRLRQEGFNPTWILTGDGPMRLGANGSQVIDFDKELFTDCWLAVEELLDGLDKELTGKDLIELVFAVYELQLLERAEGRQGMNMANVIRLVRNAA